MTTEHIISKIPAILESLEQILVKLHELKELIKELKHKEDDKP